MEHTFELKPRDLLFMRDARPMEAQDVGVGASWPRGDQIASAFHHAFMQTWPARQEWESIDGEAHTFRDKKDAQFKSFSKDKNADSSCRFGSLKVIGPFPMKGDELYLPCPADLGMRLVACNGTNLPSPLTHAFLASSQKKVSLPEWISISDYARYLKGESFEPKTIDLASRERHIGIALNDESRTTEKGKFYQAEYLRFEEDVSLVCSAECLVAQRVPPMYREKNDPRIVQGLTDVFARADMSREMILGGQQGLVSVRENANALSSLASLANQPITTKYVKWTLLSSAIFARGWLPGWVGDEKILLPRETLVRQINESRADYKRRQAQSIGIEAKLIASRIGKALVFSGWDARTNAPKEIQTAVPAGSSYVFECASVEEAKVLAKQLNYPIRRSDEQGEKGFGIGICSSIEM